MRVAFGTWAKDWLSLSDMLRVQLMSFAASRAKGRFEKVVYLRETVKVLTSKRTFFSILHYQKIIDSFGFKAEVNQAEIDEKSAEMKLIKLCSDIGSRCGKLPREVMDGMSANEIETFSKNLLMRYLEKGLQLVSAYHAPEEFSKSSQRQLKDLLRDTAQPRQAQIDRPDAHEPVSIKGMFALA